MTATTASYKVFVQAEDGSVVLVAAGQAGAAPTDYRPHEAICLPAPNPTSKP